MACTELENESLILPIVQDSNLQEVSNEVTLSNSMQVSEIKSNLNIVVPPDEKPCDPYLSIENNVDLQSTQAYLDSNRPQPKAKRARRTAPSFQDVSYDISSYECDQCGKEFKRESALKNHKLLNHDSESESGNESDMGEPKGFSRTLEDLLASEQDEPLPKKVKPRSTPQSKARKVKCTFEGCKQTFRSKSQLQKHLQKHLERRVDISSNPLQTVEITTSNPLQTQALKNINLVQLNNNYGTILNSLIKNGLPETSVTHSILTNNENEKVFLHNYLQKHNKSPPNYEIRDFGLGALDQRYVCECCIADYNHTSIGKAASINDAQKIAIKHMILYLFKNGFITAEELPQTVMREFPVDIQNTINLNKQNHNNNSHLHDEREQNTYLILTGFN